MHFSEFHHYLHSLLYLCDAPQFWRRDKKKKKNIEVILLLNFAVTFSVLLKHMSNWMRTTSLALRQDSNQWLRSWFTKLWSMAITRHLNGQHTHTHTETSERGRRGCAAGVLPSTDLWSYWAEWGQVLLSRSWWWPTGRLGTGLGRYRCDLVDGKVTDFWYQPPTTQTENNLCSLCFYVLHNNTTHGDGWRWTSPEMVLRKMRYSKLEISRRCQRWVMLDALNNCFGVAREILLYRRTERDTH